MHEIFAGGFMRLRSFGICTVYLLVAGLGAALAAPAFAETVKLPNQTRSGLQAKCDAAGGLCANCSPKGNPNAKFGCDNPNTGCSVNCDKNGQNCVGTTPLKAHPGMTIEDFLVPKSAGVKQDPKPTPKPGPRGDAAAAPSSAKLQ
jgi:hypothetical protein